MSIPEFITKMSDEEFLESLDDSGEGWHYMHEAAKRIRRLKSELAQPEDSANPVIECWFCHKKYGKGIKCTTCGREGR